MAFASEVINAFLNLNVAGVNLGQLIDVGVVLAIGFGCVLLAKNYLEKKEK